MPHPPMKPADLSSEQQDAAILRYYAGEPVSVIIETFGLEVHATQFLRSFPPVPTGSLCPHCGAAMVARRSSRRAPYPAQPRFTLATCSGCAHKDTSTCDCSACRPKRARQGVRHAQSAAMSGGEVDQRLLRVWEEACSRRPEPTELGVRSAVYLLAIEGALPSADLRLRSIVELGQQVAPTRDYTRAIMLHLEEAGLIAIDPQMPSLRDSRDLPNDSRSFADSLRWRLSLGCGWRECRQYLAQLREIVSRNWHGDTYGEALAPLWLEVMREECTAALAFQLAKFGLPAESVHELRRDVDQLLVHLSGDQVMRVTWSTCVRIAAERFANRRYGTCAEAISRRLRYLLDAFINRRLEPFTNYRHRSQPSALAQVFEGLLGLGPSYLHAVPTPASFMACWRIRRGQM